MTTVGCGDTAPGTVPGQAMAAVVMILGYSIIAVPTDILSAEFNEAKREGPVSTQACSNCISRRARLGRPALQVLRGIA